MRRVNAVTAMLIVALLLIHVIAGGFQLAGIIGGGSTVMKVLAWVMLALIGVHMLIGVKLTADTLIACKRSGTSYYRENRLFWLRRISGFAVMFFIVLHVLIFLGREEGGVFRLNYFGTVQLLSQLLLVVSLILHIVTNIRPLMLALGSRKYRDFLLDVCVILSVVLILTAAAFIVYYIRWRVV